MFLNLLRQHPLIRGTLDEYWNAQYSEADELLAFVEKECGGTEA
jgi:hypothetical protein